MRKKLLLLIFLISLTMNIVFSTNYNACNAAVPSGIHYLTQDISTTGTCFTFSNPNVIFDCQGHSLTGDGTGEDFGFYMSSKNNITIQNCTIKDFGSTGNGAGIYSMESDYIVLKHLILISNFFGIYTRLAHFNNFSNISCTNHPRACIYNWGSSGNYNTINSANDQYSIYLRSTFDGNNIENVYSKNSSYSGIYISYSDDNNITNVTLADGIRGIVITGDSDFGGTRNVCTDSHIYNNSLYNIDLEGITLENNTFSNSYLGNASKIQIISGTHQNYFIDNTYLEGTYTEGQCFDSPNNLSCEVNSSTTQTVSTITHASSQHNPFPFSSSCSNFFVYILVFLFAIF